MRGAWQGLVERVGVTALVILAILLVLATAYLVPNHPELALMLGGVALVGVLALVNPVTLPLLAMPLIVVSARASVGGVDMSLADYAIGLAFWPAALMSPRPYSPALRNLLWFNAIFQAATLFAVVANPFQANVIDWFHNWLIISGALVVGWAVGRSGAGKAGAWLFLGAVIFLAVAGIAEAGMNYLAGDFSALYPSWVFFMHKNYFGNLLCFAALLLYARPVWLGLPKVVAYSGFWICAVGLGASQARQAIVGLAVGLVVIAVKGRGERGRGWLSLFLGVPALAFVATLVRDQIASGNQHNSFFQRLEWYDQSIENWASSPWFGLGLRYWTVGRAEHNFHPPQAFLELLATTGVVGLLGFVVMLVGMVRVTWKIPGLTGSLVTALIVARIVQGQLDIFWLSPTTTTPFLLAGLCLGVLARPSMEAPSVPGRARQLVSVHG